MNAARFVRALAPVDLKNVARDPLLRWMVALPLAIAIAARWVLPPMLRPLSGVLGSDLMPYFPPLAGYALLLTPAALCGMVIGFLLLDQRDDGTLTALQVTPVPMPVYLAYRLGAPVVVSGAITVVSIRLAGLVDLQAPALMLAALAAAPMAPLYALALAAFAQNKVQGFAFVKASGVLLIAPGVAYFVAFPWQLAFGVVPTYWPARLYWALIHGEGGWPLFLIGDLAYHALLLVALLRRFHTVLRR